MAEKKAKKEQKPRIEREFNVPHAKAFEKPKTKRAKKSITFEFIHT